MRTLYALIIIISLPLVILIIWLYETLLENIVEDIHLHHKRSCCKHLWKTPKDDWFDFAVVITFPDTCVKCGKRRDNEE